jgi:integrase
MERHRPKKLMDQVRDAIRLKHYPYRTEQAYAGWIKRYIYFHDVGHPSEMGAPEVEAFLTHLAVKENVAASTQNQALSALLFLYREVLHQDLGPVDALRAKRRKRLPTVLTKDETLRPIGCLSGTHQLMAKLIYGSGVRLMECFRLCVKDLEFDRRAFIIRDGKGAQERVAVLPDSPIPLLKEHLQQVKALHEQDLAQGYGAVRFASPMPWRANTPTPIGNGVGNTCSRPAPCPRISVPVSHAATTCTRAACKRRSKRQPAWPALSIRSAATPRAIALRPTSWNPTVISEQCRSSWATRMSKRP